MATPFSYTVPNWREGSPNAAETAVYTEMMRDPTRNSGLGLLIGGELAANRHGQERNYENELAQQHVFAQQQADRHAQAQSREDLLKLIAEKNPGTLGLAYNNPILAPLLAGTDETMMGQHAQFNKQAADAEAYEKFGKGYRDFRYGGGYTAPEGMNTILAPMGVNISDVEPVDITSARLRASEQGSGTASGAPDTAHGSGSTTMKIVRRMKPDGTMETDAEARARTLDAVDPRSRTNRPMITPQRSPVSDVLPQAPIVPQPTQAPATGGGAQASPAAPLPAGSPPVPPPGQTRAPTATPNQKMDVAPSGTPGKAEAQRAAAAAIPKLAQINRAAWQSVMSRMADEGGDVPINYLPGTGWVYVGKEGIFEIPGVTRSLTTDRSGRNGVMR